MRRRALLRAGWGGWRRGVASHTWLRRMLRPLARRRELGSLARAFRLLAAAVAWRRVWRSLLGRGLRRRRRRVLAGVLFEWRRWCRGTGVAWRAAGRRRQCGQRALWQRWWQAVLDGRHFDHAQVGLGRIFASETEAPILFVNLV
jgi:hypothetical protein